ncbi:J domain-containing protein [Desulfobacterales bacterium HSG17]|nr:J domain-containing protein [Desulfobacterales bacterium HSG17]
MDDKTINCLAVLELKPGVTYKEVKSAYRDLSTVWHPDRQPDRLQSRATAKLTEINLAYEWLTKNQNKLSKLSAKTVKPTAGSSIRSILKCSKCNTRNRIDTDLKSGVYFRKYTCRACNEFLYAIVKCVKCDSYSQRREIRAFQEAESGKYRCKHCEEPLFGILKCEKCSTKNCIAPSDGKEKPVCSKCRTYLLSRHRKRKENRHIFYAIGGAIIGAIIGALGS